MTGGPDPTRITVYPDGPLVVRGDFVLDDLDAGPYETGRVIALCRCGRSATKPLCDGSHRKPRGPHSTRPGTGSAPS